jgi:hypothetical protein
MKISLLPCDPALLELAVQNSTALEEHLGARIASGWEEFASAMKVSRDKLRANSGISSCPLWLGRRTRWHRTRKPSIGGCGLTCSGRPS